MAAIARSYGATTSITTGEKLNLLVERKTHRHASIISLLPHTRHRKKPQNALSALEASRSLDGCGPGLLLEAWPAQAVPPLPQVLQPNLNSDGFQQHRLQLNCHFRSCS
ncbi:hypothetical protein M758_1G318600 [Ceratodon purpureus]|nr:hypothetical protein M758_1G318600 [Ceratodon purpureus]